MGWPRTPQLGLSVGPTWQGHRLMAPAVGRSRLSVYNGGKSGNNDSSSDEDDEDGDLEPEIRAGGRVCTRWWYDEE